MTQTSGSAAPGSTRPARFRMAGLGRHGVIYAIGILFNKAVAFVMLPVYTRYLSPADYGVLQLVTMTIEVVSIVAGARIAQGIFHFYHKASDEAGRRTVMSTAFFLLATTYGLVTAATAVVAPWMADIVFGSGSDNTILIRVAAAALLFEGIYLVPIAFFQLRERSGAYVGVQSVRLLIQLVLNLVLIIGFGLGVLGVLISSLVANFLVGGALGISLIRTVGARVQWQAVKNFLRFGIPLVGMQVAGFIIALGDRFVLNKHYGEDAVGLYGLAYQFGYLLMYLGYVPFHQAWDPVRFAVAKRPDRDEVYARVFIYINLVVVTCAVGIGLLAGDVIQIMAAAPFHPAEDLIPVMMVVFTVHAWSYFHGLGMLVTERTGLITLAHWLAAGIAIAGFFLVIPHYGAMGAAVVAAASYGARFFFLYLFSQRIWPIRYDWNPVLRVVAVGAAIVLSAQVIPRGGLVTSVAIHLGLIMVYGAGVWVLGGLTGDDKRTIARAVRSPRTFMAELKGGTS